MTPPPYLMLHELICTSLHYAISNVLPLCYIRSFLNFFLLGGGKKGGTGGTGGGGGGFDQVGAGSSSILSAGITGVSSERKTERPAWAVAGTARGPLAPIDRILTEKTTPSFGLCLPWNPDTPLAGGDAGNKVRK